MAELDLQCQALARVVLSSLAYLQRTHVLPTRMRVGPCISDVYIRAGEREAHLTLRSTPPAAIVTLVADSGLAGFETRIDA
jgi:hypothetical protein